MNVGNMAKGMNGVERHGLVMGDDIEPLPNGDYVLYTDYATLQQQLVALQEERDELSSNLGMAMQAVENLQQQLAAAREDTRRIDWIAQQGDEFSAGIIVDAPGDGDYYAHGHRVCSHGTGKTFRDAVDAAIAAEAATLQRDRQP